jgi:general stress protein 26
MAPVSFLATLEVNQPRLRAMTHYVDDDLTIWYPSLKRSGKVKQIISNSKVAISFIDTTWCREPITVYGIAEIIEDQKVKEDLWQQYEESIKSIVPAVPTSDNFVIIKVTPRSIVNNRY